MNKVGVDCSKAGANVLFVAVLGPAGQEQVHVKHIENKQFLVEFMMPDRETRFHTVSFHQLSNLKAILRGRLIGMLICCP